MPRSSFTRGRIAGIFTVYPQIQRRIDDDLALFGGDRVQLDKLKKTIGLDTRYVVDATTTAADLCERSAIRLFASLGTDRAKIDALVMVTQTPDYLQPATAASLHGKLGLSEDCAAFDVNLGCSGYVYGLWLAFMMVECGGCESVMLLAGDTMSRCVNPRDRAVAPLFGDAGSATLVTRATEPSPAHFCLHTDGKGAAHIMIPAGGFRMPRSAATAEETTDEHGNVRSFDDFAMNGAEVFNFSIKVEPAAITEILAFAGKRADEVDYLVFHQANRYIISNIMRRLKLPIEKAPSGTVEKYGNQSSASIPATICDSSIAAEVRDGARALVLSGFGVGLSWASCSLRLDRVPCEIEIYAP